MEMKWPDRFESAEELAFFHKQLILAGMEVRRTSGELIVQDPSQGRDPVWTWDDRIVAYYEVHHEGGVRQRPLAWSHDCLMLLMLTCDPGDYPSRWWE